MSSPAIMRTLQLSASPVIFCSPSPSPYPTVATFRAEKNTAWSLLDNLLSDSGVYVGREKGWVCTRNSVCFVVGVTAAGL